VSENDDFVFSGGRPNPKLAGIPLRFSSSGSEPDPARISGAAKILGRSAHYVSPEGYEREIVAASPAGKRGQIAYVESSAKKMKDFVDVSFRFVVRDGVSAEFQSELESYNPFFGCDVHFLEWFDDIAVLIYREKHDTYIAVSSCVGPARYMPIEDDWAIHDRQLSY
jgi:hypothetical protein